MKTIQKDRHLPLLLYRYREDRFRYKQFGCGPRQRRKEIGDRRRRWLRGRTHASTRTGGFTKADHSRRQPPPKHHGFQHKIHHHDSRGIRRTHCKNTFASLSESCLKPLDLPRLLSCFPLYPIFLFFFAGIRFDMCEVFPALGLTA